MAHEHGCDLIVSGIARDETFGRCALGRTVDALVRAAAIPLLVVKNRPHGHYEHLLVATDFSAGSLAALRFGVRIRPRGLPLFHAFYAPFSGWTRKTQYLADARGSALEACKRFIDEADLPEDVRRAIHPIAEHGDLSNVLQDYVCDQQLDLIVLGLPERGLVMEALIGSRAKAVLDVVPCDILLVRDRPAA